jgi:hypothetical protein
MADVTDKKRLREIQQQDLSESRLNDDFIYWLKTWGVNIGVGLLAVFAAYSLWNAWQQRKTQARDNAWAELSAATLPESYAEVAKLHTDVDSVAMLAWIAAGDAHLRDLQTGLDSTAVPTPNADGSLPPPPPLTAEQRTIAQDAADGYYAKALDAARARGTPEAMRPILLSALFGRAAIAESRGAMDAAATYLTEAAALAKDAMPELAAEATRRLESLSMMSSARPLPTRASLPVRETATPVAPNLTDELLKSLQETTPPAQPEAQPPAQPEGQPGTPPPAGGSGNGGSGSGGSGSGGSQG